MINPIASQKKAIKGIKGDWHRAYIIAALHSKGLSLAGLSREHGLAPRTLSNAFERHYPKAERIIANAIGMEPRQIWPSRYEGKNQPNTLEDEK